MILLNNFSLTSVDIDGGIVKFLPELSSWIGDATKYHLQGTPDQRSLLRAESARLRPPRALSEIGMAGYIHNFDRQPRKRDI